MPSLARQHLGDGGRFKKTVYDAQGNALEHLTLGDFEIEQLPNNFVRVRWAVPGPTGAVAWRQTVMQNTQLALNARRQSEYALAGMAWDNLAGALTNEVGTVPASVSLLGHVKGKVFGSVIQARAAGRELASFARHALAGFSLDGAAQDKVLNILFLLVLLFASLVLFSTRCQQAAHALLRRRLRALRGHDPNRPLDWGSCPRQSHSPSPLAGEGRGEGACAIPAPLAPWSLPSFRLAARLLILAFLAHGGLFLLPVQAHATPLPCPVTTLFPVSDHLGSVQKLVTAAGAVVYEQHFLPFGQRDLAKTSDAPSVCSDGSGRDPFPHGFTGHFQDDESGLVYMGGRYYNPATGHFMTPDPVLGSPGDTLSYDRYAYVRNNPINLTDPTGFNPAVVFLVMMVVGAVVGAVSAGMRGENVLVGALQGYFGAVAGFYGATGAMAWGAFMAQANGGNAVRGALISFASYAVGSFAGPAIDSAAAAFTSSAAQGAVSVIGRGIVGGLTSAALGGKFSEGFIVAAASAGISVAAAEMAGAVETQEETTGGVMGDYPEKPNSQVIPLDTGSVRNQSILLMVGGEGRPAMDQNGTVITNTPIAEHAEALATKLMAEGAKEVHIMPLDANASSRWNNIPAGRYNQALAIGHNARNGSGFLARGGGYLSKAQIASMRAGALKPGGDFHWVTCRGAAFGESTYLIGSSNMVTQGRVYGSYAGVFFPFHMISGNWVPQLPRSNFWVWETRP